jgi:hypothetical protein
MKQTKNAKGFFFVLATFIVLAYMITSISLWARATETAESSYAEKFKISNLDLIVSQISKEKVEKFSDISAYHALYTINSRSVTNPLKQGPLNSRETEYFHVKNAFWKAMSNGTMNNIDFEGEDIPSYDESEKNMYTLAGFFSNLNSTISAIGLEIDNYSVSGFNINQSSIDQLNYSFKVNFTVRDRANLAYVVRNYEIRGVLNLTGLQDPAMLRESDGKISKQFFFLKTEKNEVGPYDIPKDANPRILKSGKEGQGWFYGPIVAAKDLNSREGLIGIFERNNTILVGTYDEITNLIGIPQSETEGITPPSEEAAVGKGDSPPEETPAQSYEQGSLGYPHYLDFGAYILTNEPEVTGECDGAPIQSNTFNAIDCDGSGHAVFKTVTEMEKPFAVIPGFSVEGVTDYTNIGRRVLFVNKNSPEEVDHNPKSKLDSSPIIYDIEELRDTAICGYYVKYPYAPSYFQRLFSNSYDLNDSEFGMETFVFGKIIGGEEIMRVLSDDRSRLDKEIFSGIDSMKIRGMPGCKNVAMCIADSPIGHFKISENASKEFLGDQTATIACYKEDCEGVE